MLCSHRAPRLHCHAARSGCPAVRAHTHMHPAAREDRFSAYYKYASAIDMAWHKLLEVEGSRLAEQRKFATELRALGA